MQPEKVASDPCFRVEIRRWCPYKNAISSAPRHRHGFVALHSATLIDRDKAPGSGWHWGPLDFAVMGALLLAAGTLYEFVSTRMRAPAHRAVLGLVIAGLVLAIWVELAVGGISQLVGWATA